MEADISSQAVGLASNADFSIFNLAGVKDEGIDQLIKIVRAAKTRQDLNIAIRALDRVLRAEVIWVPQWYKNKHTIAYYDMFDHPENLPPYDLGVLDLWWFNKSKSENLKEAGALQ